MESKIKELNGDIIEQKINGLMSLTSEVFLALEQKFIELKEKKLNGEEVDEEEFSAASNAVIHCSHAMGELMETKASIFGEDNLNMMDKLLIMEYEKEMNTQLKAFIERDKFNDILNGDSE